MEFWHRECRFSIPDPYLPGKMTVSLIVDDETRDRLQAAFHEALGGKLLQLPTRPALDERPPETRRWCLCVTPDVGLRIKRQGWRHGLIFVVTQEDFDRRWPLLGPRDALLFQDVTPAHLPMAVRLSIAGMTVFPSRLLPIGEMAAPALEGFESLSDADRAVMAELARGLRNQEIAHRLGRDSGSVQQSVDRIIRRLGCLNRLEAALIAHGRFTPFLDSPKAQSDRAMPMSSYT